MYRNEWTYGHPMMSDGWGWIAALIWLLFLGAIIGLAFYFVRSYANRTGTNSHRDPIDIARERYARGEITKEQFLDIKRELK